MSESQAKLDAYVWVASLATGEIKRKAPKNISIVTDLYDGPGGFLDSTASLEEHLGRIESAAALAIRKLEATPSGNGATIPSEIWRFLAWQAARTPGWMELDHKWANEWLQNQKEDLVEPPPEGFNDIADRTRPLCLENSETGERREVVDGSEFEEYLRRGWKWVLRRDDHLEMLHLQAWYFQVRHFPRFSWTRLDAPAGEWSSPAIAE